MPLKMNKTRLENFIAGYIECALWCSSADIDPPGEGTDDRSIGDVAELADLTRDLMTTEAREWFIANDETIESAECDRHGGGYSKEAQAGHDFWLTRNGHGAGFWDGDWSEPQATLLTKAAKKAGGRNLYIGDDGLIYQG